MQHYYTGITLSTKPVIISSDTSQLAVEQSFYAPKKYAVVVVDNKFGVENLKIDINGQEKVFDLPKEVFGHKRFCEIDISQYVNKGRNTVVFTSPEFFNSSAHKGLRLYVKLVEKNDDEYIW